jgi:hypothetical protein
VSAGGRWRRLGQRTAGTGQEWGERLVAAAGQLGAQARGWPRLERGAGGARLAGVRMNGGRPKRRVVRADSCASTGAQAGQAGRVRLGQMQVEKCWRALAVGARAAAVVAWRLGPGSRRACAGWW